jgi:NADPH-dependent curcumin reductase CurA
MRAMTANRRFVLKRYPSGVPVAADFELVDVPIATPAEGEVLVETHWLSMDPLPRLRMDPNAKFPPPLPLGALVVGRGVGLVRASRADGFAPGDWVAGELGWQEHAVVPATALRRVDPGAGPVQSALGVLGPSGITAWCLVNVAARVREGDTVVVAAAAGSVGSVAVQLAKLAGARVVGIVGGPRQAEFVRDAGAESSVDHRSTSLAADLAAALPQGASVFLDSVGGRLHEAVMERLAEHARVVAFGFISAYNAGAGAQPEYGRIYELIRRRATLSGFLVGDHVARFPEALAALSTLLREGRLRNAESVSDGLESAPAAFARLFDADPVGKQLVRVR